MASPSKIEWTEYTWNPVVGCSIVSPGCTNCYAMKMASRIEAMKSSHYDGTTKKVNGNAVWTGKLALAPDHILLEPLKRKKPTTYFVNSMGDLFHERTPWPWIDNVFAVMALAPHHTFQVLTKRPERMREYLIESGLEQRVDVAMVNILADAPIARLPTPVTDTNYAWPLPNVWLGVSTERQQEADERIPLLLQTPAAVRFISAEPLLGPIDLMMLKDGERVIDAVQGCVGTSVGDGEYDGAQPCAKLDWIIAGGESGRHARPMHPDWARSLRDQCAAAGVAFFFKQWGEWLPGHHYTAELHAHDSGVFSRYACMDWEGSKAVETDANPGFDETGDHAMWRVGKKAAGRLLDGIEHNAMPGHRIPPIPEYAHGKTRSEHAGSSQ